MGRGSGTQEKTTLFIEWLFSSSPFSTVWISYEFSWRLFVHKRSEKEKVDWWYRVHILYEDRDVLSSHKGGAPVFSKNIFSPKNDRILLLNTVLSFYNSLKFRRDLF
jgi:hypothetical protein